MSDMKKKMPKAPLSMVKIVDPPGLEPGYERL